MEATNTTMRFQVRSTTAGELKASALRSSALVLARFSDLTQEEDIAAFRSSILDVDAATRQLACHAIENLSQRPEDLDLLVLTAAQDGDENVAATALHTIATLYRKRALSLHHEFATVVARRALASPSAVVRQLGTHLAATLLENISDPETRRTLLSMWSVGIEVDGSIPTIRCSATGSAKRDRYNNRYSRPKTATPHIAERRANFFRIFWCG